MNIKEARKVADAAMIHHRPTRRDIGELLSEALDDIEALQEDSDFLAALESAGVDNWDGYDYAMESLNVF